MCVKTSPGRDNGEGRYFGVSISMAIGMGGPKGLLRTSLPQTQIPTREDW